MGSGSSSSSLISGSQKVVGNVEASSRGADSVHNLASGIRTVSQLREFGLKINVQLNGAFNERLHNGRSFLGIGHQSSSSTAGCRGRGEPQRR